MSIQTLFDLCTKNGIEIGVHARISRPNLIEAISDVMCEGSGLLNIYHESYTTGTDIARLLQSIGRYYIETMDYVSIVIDENDINILNRLVIDEEGIDSDQESDSCCCDAGCKCINCHALETTCDLHCKCINCSSALL